MRRILIALTFLFLSTAAAPSAAELRLDPRTGTSDAQGASTYLRDPGGHWTLAEVIARRAEFRPVATLVPSLHAWAFAPSTLWFRLEPRSTGAGPWYLHASMAVDFAEMVYIGRDGRVVRTRFGTLEPYNTRLVPAESNILELPPEATRDGTVYLRFVTRQDLIGGYSIRPAVWEATTGRAIAESRLLSRFIILGVIGGLALFNGLLGLLLRERIYYVYAGATGCFSLLEFMTTGAAWRWFWPSASVPFDVVVYPAYLCYLALMLLFAREFLDLATTQRTLWRAMLAIFCCGALADTAFIVAPNLFDRAQITNVLDPICSGLLLSAVLSSGVIAWRRGYVGAARYVVAYAGVLCGILIGTLGNGFVLPSNGWTNSAPALGVAWEAVFLALALAERIRRLRGERDALEVEALEDALTGIPNRRAFDRRLADEWRRGARGGTQLATIVADVDFFKSFNDTYGHVAGDAALKRVATCITGSIHRADDFVARYGGEEFVVLLPYSSVADAVAVADTIRGAVVALGIPHASNPSGRLTISAGAAGAVPSNAAISEELITAADRALYAAKRTGRNRVVESATLIA